MSIGGGGKDAHSFISIGGEKVSARLGENENECSGERMKMNIHLYLLEGEISERLGE
jgi:hypothetical protein